MLNRNRTRLLDLPLSGLLLITNTSCQAVSQVFKTETPPPKKLMDSQWVANNKPGKKLNYEGGLTSPAEGERMKNEITPQTLIRSDFELGELLRLCQNAIDAAQNQADSIVKIPDSQRTFENSVLAFELLRSDFADATLPLGFMKYVSTDTGVHAEGAQCEQLTGDFEVKLMSRRDLYDALRLQRPRSPEEKRLLEKTLEAFESNGLKLPDSTLAKVTQLFTKLNELQNSFSDHLNNDQTTVELSIEELEGVSKDFLTRLKKTSDSKRYVVTTKITDYEQVMQNAKNEAARAKMAFAYNNRQAQVNTDLLEQALQVRQQIAILMGYKNWADYQLSTGRMAKNSSEVMGFLNNLKTQLAESNRKDLTQLLQFKKSYDPNANEVKVWDIPYLSYQLKKKEFQLDDEEIREYFPADSVVQGMFKIYAQILGVRFQLMERAKTWSPDVKVYQIVDSKNSQTIGYFYADFIPRTGKYSHFAAFTLQKGRMTADGYSKPISAIVGNFNPPANGKPSLLSHSEVVTLFHEFGHIMHQTLTRAPYGSLAGSSVPRDFVEAPSQMLENWPWQEKILDLISGHYQNPAKKLPPETLKKMLLARDYQQGYFYTRQLTLALTDMAYHTSTSPVDTATTYNRIFRELTGIAPIEGGHFAASFGHLMGGYDAGYYGYLWSLVYATDLFTAFETSDILDAQTGKKYRELILEKGDMEEIQSVLTQFLGRPSNSDAFFRKLHLAPATSEKSPSSSESPTLSAPKR